MPHRRRPASRTFSTCPRASKEAHEAQASKASGKIREAGLGDGVGLGSLELRDLPLKPPATLRSSRESSGSQSYRCWKVYHQDPQTLTYVVYNLGMTGEIRFAQHGLGMVFCRKGLQARSPRTASFGVWSQPLTEAVQEEQEATHLRDNMLVGRGNHMDGLKLIPASACST